MIDLVWGRMRGKLSWNAYNQWVRVLPMKERAYPPNILQSILLRLMSMPSLGNTFSKQERRKPSEVRTWGKASSSTINYSSCCSCFDELSHSWESIAWNSQVHYFWHSPWISEAGSKAQFLQFDPLPALKFLLINAVKAGKLWQCLSHLTCITDLCILTL